MASKLTTTSQHILDNLGGPENITSMTHCATRLRFQVKDQSAVDQETIDFDPSVLGVVPQGSTGMQVVMGGSVANYYQEILKLDGMKRFADGESANTDTSSKKEYGGVRGKYSWIDYAFEFLSDTFRPVLWALLGASLIITLLVLADTFGLQDFRAPMDEQPSTYVFLHAMWRSVFYFLPIMVGATAARKLGANEWIGAAIPAALLTPEFLALGSAGDTVQVFGMTMVLNDYSGQVFPPLIAAIGLYWVEKGLKKIIPEAIQMVFVPFFSLLIMIPATAFLLGPFGIGVGNGISNMLEAINNFSPFILSIVIPLLYPFLVPLGLHWPLNAIMIQNINTLGYDFIQGPMGAWNFACFGLVTGVFLLSIRERNKAMRQVSLGGMLAGLLGGISEPSLYGVLLRFKKTYFRLLPGCLAGGIVMGIFDIKAYAFVFTSLLTIPAMDPWLGYTIGIAVAFFVSMLLVLVFDYRSDEERDEARAKVEAMKAGDTDAPAAGATAAAPVAGAAAAAPAATAVATKPRLAAGEVVEIVAPLEGRTISLSEVPDPIFAAGKLGPGIAIEPTGNTVVAPADATVILVQKSGHAVALRLESGIEILIHIGLDTVQLGGEGFTVHVERKQQVKAGDPLITFDPEFIRSKNLPLITPVVVSNANKFGEIVGVEAAQADATTTVIKVNGAE
ncbi:PTS system glucose-specific EIIBCA component [Corynebacterium deserti GIMN1.010]|uniref:PTS system glucose-specific EIIBCA component n=1 Tax=Corynebacterium deserti GIMN1.010 TaxID=931089 RepID=A0A0M4CPQ6_9CORY|nr:glucose PTS transporter subunit IIA [Corynebacterium deserti]ALC05730.1 PTS system glucose-specific EIIBCA component [Corynebacterium deserti GIMN1.010]